MLGTRGKAIFSDSGRKALNEIAFTVFLKNPLLGIGFGRENYKQLVGMLPHNILYQSLAQGGLVYTIPLILFMFLVVWETYKRNSEILPVLLCVLVGGLFVPNLFNSRFVPVLFLLSTIISF